MAAVSESYLVVFVITCQPQDVCYTRHTGHHGRRLSPHNNNKTADLFVRIKSAGAVEWMTDEDFTSQRAVIQYSRITCSDSTGELNPKTETLCWSGTLPQRLLTT